jgi:hypothetical protein
MSIIYRSWWLGLPLVVTSCATTPGSQPNQLKEPVSVSVAALSGSALTGVPSANTKAPGISSASALSVELRQVVVAQGSNALENPGSVPSGDGSSISIPYYGYDGDGPMLPAPGDVPAVGHKVEATKTEPDKNTYLVLRDQIGADPYYDYGKHFMYQGHESGATNAAGQVIGTITRINLDADLAHRVTLMAATDVNGAPLPSIDGSTWDPFAKRLLFTAEFGGATAGGVWQGTLDVPSSVEDISGAFGRAGYEGIQNDSDGNLWIAEDVGGKTGTVNPHSKQPNSFIYRFVPKNKHDLKQGKLQALQVMSLRTGTPIAFNAGMADADATSGDVGDLHTYGNTFLTRWVTLHDTDIDGYAPFGANALAKSMQATPFKRPENAMFRPGSRFREFFFDETGDTDNRTEVGAGFGGFGSVMKLTQTSPSANSGTLSLFYLSDQVHSAFDNVAFWDKDSIVFVEDAGDTLHTQRNALDSAWMLDVNADYSKASNQPVRIIAEGRDPAATLDSAFLGLPGFSNEGDNEITGIHISDGDASEAGILGAKNPKALESGWRVFYTQQHGENFTWEILRNKAGSDD